MSKVSIRNVGPVIKLDFETPAEGGVVVMRGRNGRGKSTVINAVESAINPSRGRVSVTDGEATGQVEAFGVEMRIGRKSTRLGELEVETLEGRLSVADLVEPGIKTPEAADAKRIKALVQLAEVPASAELFYSLFGGQEGFEAVVRPQSLETDDLVVLAEKIKADAERKARELEDSAEHARRNVAIHEAASKGIDLEGEADKAKLDRAYQEAFAAVSRLEGQRDGYNTAKATYDANKAKRDVLKATYAGQPIEAAQQAEADANAAAESMQLAIKAAEEQRAAIQRQLDAADASIKGQRAEYAVLTERVAAAVAARHAAERHAQEVRALQEAILEGLPEAPSDDAIAAANKALDEARAAIVQGERVREAREHATLAEAARKKANDDARRALELRDAGQRIDEVLSKAVSKAGTPLVVEAGRLKIAGTKRTGGKTNFGELSHGERWRLGMEIAIAQIKKTGRPGLIALPQEAYESLDGVARRIIAETVAGTGVVVLTAECSMDEEIVAGTYDAKE
jgi:ABC-type cobalamin/Fe3+-siderophores transport system ATPase subunit